MILHENKIYIVHNNYNLKDNLDTIIKPSHTTDNWPNVIKSTFQSKIAFARASFGKAYCWAKCNKTHKHNFIKKPEWPGGPGPLFTCQAAGWVPNSFPPASCANCIIWPHLLSSELVLELLVGAGGGLRWVWCGVHHLTQPHPRSGGWRGWSNHSFPPLAIYFQVKFFFWNFGRWTSSSTRDAVVDLGGGVDHPPSPGWGHQPRFHAASSQFLLVPIAHGQGRYVRRMKFMQAAASKDFCLTTRTWCGSFRVPGWVHYAASLHCFAPSEPPARTSFSSRPAGPQSSPQQNKTFRALFPRLSMQTCAKSHFDPQQRYNLT